jgi:hypothetical protein
MSNLADTAKPVDNNLLRPKQVSPLPIGSGGSNTVKTQMNNTNVQLAMLNAQAVANTKYDPPVPKHLTSQITKEGFTNHLNISNLLYVIGGLLIVYAFVVK